jgi:hypothetical protein
MPDVGANCSRKKDAVVVDGGSGGGEEDEHVGVHGRRRYAERRRRVAGTDAAVVVVALDAAGAAWRAARRCGTLAVMHEPPVAVASARLLVLVVVLVVVLAACVAACAPPVDAVDAGEDDGALDGGAGDDDGGSADDDAGTPVVDAGPGGARADVAACVATRDPDPERVDVFADATATTWVALGRTRDPDSFGTSGTTPWFGDALAVSSASVSFCVVDRAAIEYTVSHHNFADEAEATADGTTVRVVFDIADYDDLTPELHLFVDGVQTATLAPVD